MNGKYKNKAFTLRIDETLIEELKIIAEKNSRTTTKQIEIIIREWLENERKKGT